MTPTPSPLSVLRELVEAQKALAAADLPDELLAAELRFNTAWNDVEAMVSAPPEGESHPVAWRCFHCNEVFADESDAREHFGPSEHDKPACQIDIAEYRRMQAEHWRQLHEDTDWHRAFYRLGSEHEQRLRRHGDEEYARGLRDGVNLPADSPERAVLSKNGMRAGRAGAADGGATADARDAARYRWLRDESNLLSYTSDTGPQPSTPESRMMYAINSAGKRTTDMIEIRLLCYHLGPFDEPIWRDGEHFDYAANMDAAIDAAIDAAMKGKPE